MKPLLIELPLSEKDLQRFYSKIKINEKTNCWEWIGTILNNGYPQFILKYSKGIYKKLLPYRISYLLYKGDLKEELELDHLCRNPICVNPEHLEQVTHGKNVNRGIGWGGINSRKTHCPQGHPYSGENLLIEKNNRRRCKICKKIKDAKYHKKRLKFVNLLP